MIIKLNGEDIQWDPKDHTMLGDLLEEFVSKRFFRDEFIAGLSVNGQTIPDSDMDKLKTRSLETSDMLEISSDTFRNVSIRALESMDEYVDGLVGMVEQSAEKFRIEGEAEANRHFINCVEGLQTFVGIIDKVKTINGLDFDALRFEDSPVGKKEQQLLNVLNVLLEAQQRRDWVALADILEYELAPLVTEWRSILHLVASTLKGMQ